MLKWSYRKYLLRRWPDVSAFGGWFERYTHIYEISRLSEVKTYAEDSFWDAWKEYHFDLQLIYGFYKQVPQLKEEEEVKISDGKNVIKGKRIKKNKAILTGGYTLPSILTKEQLDAQGYSYTPHRKIRVGIDHKLHFIERYQKRRFDLGLAAIFISKIAQTKLGQRVKIISEDDIMIGTRTTMNNSMLITGMRRGEIDWEDYVDRKMDL